jgi:glycosyltransferase involved in cell wall biosynthesis
MRAITMQEKILYIGTDVQVIKSGNQIVNYRNKVILKRVFGNLFFDYSLRYPTNFFCKLLNKLFLLPYELSPTKIADCVKLVKTIKPKWVFIASSQYGKLIKAIKKHSDAIIITYFHNIERVYAYDYITLKKPHTLLFYWLCRIGEKLAVTYTDICICINERDKIVMKKIYNRECNTTIPVSLNDKLAHYNFTSNPVLHQKIQSRQCLFVGSNFFGNTQGLTWFIENVLPQINIRLIIVGTGMTKAFTQSDKITVYDYVDDLSPFYFEADFIISPIISGSGMKTKTAEALMYGKAIIGTRETFEGYHLYGNDKLIICNNAEEFILCIEKIYNQDVRYYNQGVRDIFMKLYSTEKIEGKFIELFEGL